MIRENGFYWVDVKTEHSLVREVAEWANDTWYACGFDGKDDLDDADFEILNINENIVVE